MTRRSSPRNAYDLVISREVLEHLTVLQVKRAVANMVRMTRQFIYVTTRFHPESRLTARFHDAVRR
jgi:2-polyprenyl-3-methyl-5-hydroxy-6-metoxy-1,4-benzoquinol methylase